jgi:hypothetical protein
MDIYQTNLHLLQQKDPQLARRVDQEADDATARVHTTPSKAPTIFIQSGGKTQALHHPQQPFEQSQQFLASIENLHQAHNIAILGCGMGYIPLLIHNGQPSLQNLFILEPSISVFRLALQTMDLSSLLRAKHTHFIIGNSPGDVYRVFMNHLMEILANPLLLIDVPAFTSTFPDWASHVRNQIQDAFQFGQSGLLTKFKDGPRCIANLLRNLPSIHQSPGVNIFKNVFKERPAIIVAAGPSLQKNIHALKHAQERFVIFATDTTYHSLLTHAITPHFVITVDPTELNTRHFPSDRYDTPSILVFDPEARPEIPPKFSRTLTYMTDKHPFFAWLNEQTEDKGIIIKGSMVSHTAFHIASYLECSPIIFMGQDLALDARQGATHIQEAAICRNVTYLEDDPHHVDVPNPTSENKSSREPLFWVEGTEGGTVPTIQSFLVYLRLLEEDIRKTSTPIIDATEGGARIAGTQIKTFSEVLDGEGKEGKPIAELIETTLAAVSSVSHQNLGALHAQLKTILKDRVDIAREGMDLINQTEDPARLNQELQAFKQRIFSDPVSEYLIEYSAPRELFDFLKLGMANASPEEKVQGMKNRFAALFKATIKAYEVFCEYEC